MEKCPTNDDAIRYFSHNFYSSSCCKFFKKLDAVYYSSSFSQCNLSKLTSLNCKNDAKMLKTHFFENAQH